jgi:hypothetical protein
MKKTTITIVATAAAISVLGVGAVEASTKKVVAKSVATTTTTKPSIAGVAGVGHVDPITTVLADLVKKGTITQAQSDAITAALNAARPAFGDRGGMGAGTPGFDKQAVVLSTLGIDAATLQAGFAAGKTLAQIAGTKTDALIAALVAAETKAIDAAVTAGTMTAANAATAKAGLVAHITAEVNQVGPMGPMGGKPGMGGRGHGHMDAPVAGTTTTTSNN